MTIQEKMHGLLCNYFRSRGELGRRCRTFPCVMARTAMEGMDDRFYKRPSMFT